MRADSEQEYLKQYDIHQYDIPLTSVDVVIFSLEQDELQVLVSKRNQHPQKDYWALPGGFVDQKKDKTIEATAFRKLFEKTGIRSPYLEQVISVGNAKRDPRGWSVTIVYFALLQKEAIQASPDAANQTAWLSIQQLKKTKLAFDHQELIRSAHERLINKVEYTALPVFLMPTAFSLPDLQKTYEILLEKPLEKKSFRRRFLDANILEETGDMQTRTKRSAALYRYCIDENHYFPRCIGS